MGREELMLKDKQEEMDAQFKKEKEEVWAEQESHKNTKKTDQNTPPNNPRDNHTKTLPVC